MEKSSRVFVAELLPSPRFKRKVPKLFGDRDLVNNIFKLIWKFVKQKIIDGVPLRSNNIARYSELTKIVITKVRPV